MSRGELGRYPEEIAACKEAIRLKPDDAEAHVNLGAAYGELGRWQEALEAEKQAIRLNPDDPLAHCNLGAAGRRRWRPASRPSG
jgi:Flp pilus assembly protein TadD